jgi:hypothetical protein
MKIISQHLLQSSTAFVEVTSGIYLVIKVTEPDALSKGQYVTGAKVTDTLNTVQNVAIFNNKLKCIHTNFNLEDEEENK